ncbi:MAG: hypothetical protein ABMA02_09015 [Saprospiraceae bacterium]
MNAIISTWIYLDAPEERSDYPQVGKQSHLPEFQMVYWKCVAVFYALSKRVNPNARHILFTNQREDQLPVDQGFNWPHFLRQLEVEIVTLPLTWQTPSGFHGMWRNQFYIFDILQFFEKQVHDDDSALLVFDSDCLINRPLDRLVREIQKDGLLVLTIPFDLDDNINGITRRDMRRLFAELDGGTDPGYDPIYYGGEVFASTLPAVRQINARMPGLWENMLTRYEAKTAKFNEEAHFLSYFYNKIRKFGPLEPFIRRIWTSTRYTDVQASDADLPIWHLPSEKTGGIAILFDWLRANRPLPASITELGMLVGVPVRSRYRNLRHRLKYTALYRLWLKISGT